MKYFNILGAAILPALLFSAGVRADESAQNGKDSTLQEQAADNLNLPSWLGGPKKDAPASEEVKESKVKPVAPEAGPGDERSLKQRIKDKFSDIKADIKGLFSRGENKVVFMPDVEGSWEKVRTFVESTGGLIALDENDNFYFTNPNDKKIKFICGGDTVDKGKNNKKILRALVTFKKAEPDRVVLLLGNRDINKLRLNWELSKWFIRKLPGADRINMTRGSEFVDIWGKAWKSSEAGQVVYQDFDPVTTKEIVDRITWLFNFTYGAPTLFIDLKDESGPGTTDDDVIAYLASYAKVGGDYNEYQMNADILYYDEGTQFIFMHGGIFHEVALGAIPGMPTMPVTDKKSLLKWIVALNAWAKDRIKIGANINIGNSVTPAEQANIDKVLELIAYQEPIGPIRTTFKLDKDKKPIVGKDGNPVLEFDGAAWGSMNNDLSVVVGRPKDEDGNFSMDFVPEGRLVKSSVRGMIVGHSPTGEVPLLMLGDASYGTGKDKKRFIVVDADTSFATKPNATAVIIAQNSGVTMKAPYITSKEDKNPKIVIISTKNDPEVGLKRVEQVKDTGKDGKTTIKNKIFWPLGIMDDGTRLNVTFYPDSRSKYHVTPGPIMVK